MSGNDETTQLRIAEGLVQKLKTFADNLSEEERKSFHSLLNISSNAITGMNAADLFGADNSALSDKIRAKLSQAQNRDSGDIKAATTVTVVTLTTVAASHPKIGC